MSDEPSSKTSPSPWSQTGFVLAAAFIAVLVLVGVVLLIVGSGGDGSTGGVAATKTAEPSTQATKADPNASVCGLAPGNQRIPAAPPDARWELVGTVAAPTAPTTLGPGISKGSRRLCFAHSPAGALFAAINFIAVAGEANDDEKLMRELTAEGAARNELLARESTASRRDPDFRIQVAGFRFPAVAANEVTVEVAFTASGAAQQGYVGMTLPMRWERGDWKLVITSTEETYGAQRLDGTSGFVPWSGA